MASRSRPTQLDINTSDISSVELTIQTSNDEIQRKRSATLLLDEIESNSTDETESLRQVFHTEFKDLEERFSQLKSYSKTSRQNIDQQLENFNIQNQNVEVERENQNLKSENEILRRELETLREKKVHKIDSEVHYKIDTLLEKLEAGKEREKKIDVLVRETGDKNDKIVLLQRKVDEIQSHREDVLAQKKNARVQALQRRKVSREKSKNVKKRISDTEIRIGSLNRMILNLDAENEEVVNGMEEESIRTEAKTKQNIEDLEGRIERLKNVMGRAKRDQEKVSNFSQKIDELSEKRDSMRDVNQNLATEIEKYKSISKQHERAVEMLKKYETVPSDEYIEGLQKKISDLTKQIESGSTNTKEQIQKYKTRAQECYKRQREDEIKLSKETKILENEISTLEKENSKLRQENKEQNLQHKRHFCEVRGKLQQIADQATQESFRFRELMHTEKLQGVQRPIDLHFIRRLESEASYTLGVLQREIQQTTQPAAVNMANVRPFVTLS